MISDNAIIELSVANFGTLHRHFILPYKYNKHGLFNKILIQGRGLKEFESRFDVLHKFVTKAIKYG
jgi:hypothetical protein